MTSVTISMDDYKALERRAEVAEREKLALKAEIKEAWSTDPAGRIVKLNELARELLHILRFAVANLPPDVVRGWPTMTLRAITERVTQLPDLSEDDASLIIEINAFADEADRFERQRALLRPSV